MYGDVCLCFEKAPREELRLPEDKCIFSCAEEGLDCGGDFALSLYQATGKLDIEPLNFVASNKLPTRSFLSSDDDGQDTGRSMDEDTEDKLNDFADYLQQLNDLRTRRKTLQEEINVLDKDIADDEYA